MNADLIDPAGGDVVWTPPWRPVTGEERRRLVVQLAREVSTIHPLAGQHPQVIGVRDGSDQILVRLRQRPLAVVLLEWTAGPGAWPDRLPAVAAFTSVADFNAAPEQAQADADEALARQRKHAA